MLGRRLAQQGGAALVIDYGHAESAAGDTLQAVGGHAFADPLDGARATVDLTAHVDFQALAQARREHGRARARAGRAGDIPAPLGIEKRAAALKANARRDKAAEIDARSKRLTGEGRTEMGALFKVLAIADPNSARCRASSVAAVIAVIKDAMLHAPSLADAARHPPRLLHPRRRRVGGRLREPQRRRRLERRARQGRREPRPHGGGARRRAGASPHLPIRSIRRRGRRRDAVDAERPAARRRHRDAHARPRHRRLHRRLRAGAVRRSRRRA